MNKLLKNVLDALWFVVVFLFIQMAFQFAVVLYDAINVGTVSIDQLTKSAPAVAANGKCIAVITATTSLFTILLFARMEWALMTKTYLRSHSWGVCLWVVLLTVGTIL